MKLRTLLLLAITIISCGAARPNILWISCEDISPHLGCYGVTEATTPNLDELAKRGLRFTNASTVTGVCATCRNSMITGMYPSTLGSQFMRCRVEMPHHVRMFPEYFRDAGYYCTNNSKTDYNVPGNHASYWDESSRSAHWRNRKRPDQPFFAVFNFTNTHESKVFNYRRPQNLTDEELHDPDRMTVPPYYPNTDIVRRDWAHYFDNITSMDKLAGELLNELTADGLAEDTIVVFWSDHGVGLPRAKRWIYESGTRVPLIIHIPEKFRAANEANPGSVTDELVSMMDLPATMMNLTGIEIPEHFHGQPFLGTNRSQPRNYLFTIRDRMDERYDMIRAVRDKRYKYIRNYQSYKPYFQIINYMEQEHTMQELRRLHAASKLPPSAEMWMQDSKPLEELYDLQADPHEIHNLVAQAHNDPHLSATLERLRNELEAWIFETRDTGLIPEPELAIRAKKLGSRYAILQQPQSTALLQRLITTNQLACGDPSGIAKLQTASQDADAAVRFWALTGLGNLADNSTTTKSIIQRCLKDDSGCVRIAAARAAWKTGHANKSLPVIEAAAKSGQEFLALMAMHLIDDMGPDAAELQPVVNWVQANASGYPVRIAEHLIRKQEPATSERRPQ